MDAFFLKHQLFTQDVMVLLDQPKEQEEDGNEYKKLQLLIKTHGGVLLDQHDSNDARVNIVLLDGRNQDQNELKNRFPLAEIVNVQWIKDSIQQNRRLEIPSYCIQDKQHLSYRMESQAMKKQKTVAAQDTADFNPKEASVLHLEATKPQFRPWTTIHKSVYVLDTRPQMQDGKQATDQSYKVAAFDLDCTLIVTKSGKKYARNHNDWKWFHPTLVRDKLAKLARDGFTLTIYSNQNGVAQGHITAAQLQNKLETIVQQLDLPVLVFLATENDIMRKPRLGVWKELAKLLSAKGEDAIDKEASFYCGDAAGRPKIAGRSKDFAATDYKFALNAGIRFFTPESFFLIQNSEFIHVPKPPLLIPASAQIVKEEQEMVVLVGPPASGKSFFANTYLSSYVLVSQDELRTAANCKKKCLEAIAQQKSVVIDNTNCDPRARKAWIEIAKEKNLPIRCFEMDVNKLLSMHLNTFRWLTQQKKVPDVAIHGFYKNFVSPTEKEGFAEVIKVPFRVNRNVSDVDQALLLSYVS
ncbi:unnamed protein product [Peronospora belbahrii]|uniref:BRCT domain-containing protein n=1 Tax=Peronospora belbahrii TaxID=622444 RepID=A0AAU9LAV4_9STRA|nr:unnamed protein product [Peronospora belbahrii]